MNHFIPEIIIILTISIIKILLKDIPNYKLMPITLLSNKVITMKGVITLPEKYIDNFTPQDDTTPAILKDCLLTDNTGTVRLVLRGDTIKHISA